MNVKKARKLRKQICAKGKLSIAYKEELKKIIKYTDLEGKEQEAKRVAIVLDKCERKRYQQLKKDIKCRS